MARWMLPSARIKTSRRDSWEARVNIEERMASFVSVSSSSSDAMVFDRVAPMVWSGTRGR